MTASEASGPHASPAMALAGAAQRLWWPLVLFALVSVCVIGTIGSILSVVCAILALPVLLDAQNRAMLSGRWDMFVFPASFVILALIFAVQADQADDLKYIFNFTSLMLAPVVFVLARHHAGAHWALILTGLAGLGALAGALAGMVQVSLDGGRAMGWFNNPNMYAHMVLILGFMALPGLYLTEKPWRFLFLVGPFAGVAATILSGSRGTMLAVPFLGLLALGYMLSFRRGRKWVLIGLALVIAAAAWWLLFVAEFRGGLGRIATTIDTVYEVLRTGDSGDVGTEARLAVYFHAWQAWMESPIFGHGWAGALEASTSVIDRPRVQRLAETFPHMHQDYLGFAASAGIFGLLCYVAMMAAPLFSLRQRDGLWRHRAYLALMLILSYVVFGLFDAMFGFDTGISSYVILTALLAGSFTGRAPGKAQTGA